MTSRTDGRGGAAIATEKLRKVYPLPGGGKRRPGPPQMAAGLGAPPLGASPNGATQIVALEGLDLEIPEGEFFGLLGPNGAGKSTTIGILTTRVRPSGGRALVAGEDVVAQAAAVRRRIGVVPQRPNPDRSLDVMENLVFHAAYFGVPRAEATSRATRLLETLGLADRKRAKVDELSGGQQQRLMIARALIHEPAVIFLDEPTVGLDPQARLALWDILRDLHRQGRTIVMTTHYMEEADQLCDRLGIVDRGRLLALDTPEALKERAPGGTLVTVTLDGDAREVAGPAGAVPGVERAEAEGPKLRAYSARGGEIIPALIRAAEGAKRSVKDIQLREPSLETLFISLTGRTLD
ncbi:MAG TPA: ABC transporter ATP-binding protein [Gemmatimonadaceae bacterium]|nr:ABC transporter ATP-binding protein [Gemmatimonadaceae bacterium]